jgi:hypothetical protein
MSSAGWLPNDTKGIRHRAHQGMEGGPVASNDGGIAEERISLLHHAVTTEIVSILCYALPCRRA